MNKKQRLYFIALMVIFGQLFLTHAIPAKQLANSSQEILKKQILRSINLLRARQAQPPLAFRDSLLPQKRPANLAVFDNPGGISGTLHGLEDGDYYFAFVVAWSVDSTADAGEAHFAKVEPDGRYIIEGLQAGKYFVLALVEGYDPQFYDQVANLEDATPVPVEPGQITEEIDFHLQQTVPGNGSISGLVLSESDNHPIANALITVFSPDNPFHYGSAFSSEDGRYQITGLQSGNYYASAWAEGYLVEFYVNAETIDEATLIEVVDANESANINFSLSRGGVISGRVVNDNGQAIAGAMVEAVTRYRGTLPPLPDSSFVSGWGYAITDDDGVYEIGGLPAGDYFVLARAWNHWFFAQEWYDNAQSIDEATAVPVTVGQETADIDFQLTLPEALGEIVGKVTDLDGQPIAGAYIQAQSISIAPDKHGNVWAHAFTNKAGEYRIEHLPNGRYLVSASAHSGWQFVRRWWPDAKTPAEAEPVEVNSATDLTPINFKLPLAIGTAAVSGLVSSNTGEPLPFAFIELSPADPSTDAAAGAVWAYAHSDSNGQFKIENLPAGRYVARAQFWQGQSFGQQWYDHAEFRSQATVIELAEGDLRDDINFDLTLRPFYGAIAGTVTDELQGAPVHRAYVEIAPKGFNYFESAPFRFWSYFAISNEQGNYQLEWLPRGEYLISVYTDGGFEYYENAVVADDAKPVQVVGGETTAINFAVTPRNDGTGVITGKVTGEWNEELLEIAVVTARPVITPQLWPDSERFYNTVVNADGSYEIKGLPPGEYLVFSFAPGHIGEYFDDAYEPAKATPVKVDGVNPATGIDFRLQPMLILRADFTTGPESGTTVFGKITDENGRALQNATVYLFDENEKPVSFARSTADGRYELSNIPPGTYRVKANQVGYKSKYHDRAESFSESTPMEIASGVVEVNFVLAPATVTGIDNHNDAAIPETIEVYDNYPNPFNPETRISFGLPAEMRIEVRIYNLLGQEVRQLFDGALGAGEHALIWDGRNQSGETMPSGLYIYTLIANQKRVAVKKMTLLK
ncbi:MAG: carboxypeptidase regulatory-like domain-containing protein [bacterium]